MRKSAKKSSQKIWNMKGCSKTRRNLGGKRKNSRHNATCRCKRCCLMRKIRTRRQRGGNCGCGLQLGGQRGGNCGCGLQLGVQNGGCTSCLAGGVGVQSGGGINNGGTPLVGKPWSVNDEGNTNYYSLNKYPVDPQTSMASERNQQTFKGGRRNKKAGGFVPQDLVNLGRSMVYGLGSAYNTLNGYSVPSNPLPYKDQLVNTPSVKAMGY